MVCREKMVGCEVRQENWVVTVFCIYWKWDEKKVYREIAGRIRKTVQESPFVQGEKVISMTVSIGAASLNGESGIDTLIQQADVALYQAKRKGRNQVCAKWLNLPTILEGD